MGSTPVFGWPYPDPSDLVRDLPADFELFADAVDASFTGGIQQVKSSNRTTSFTASLAFGATANVTDLAVTITPRDSSNLMIVSVSLAPTRDQPVSWAEPGYRVYRAGPTFVGDQTFLIIGEGTTRKTAVILDSPATASPITYQVQVVNRSGSATQTLGVNGSTYFSNITVFEVQG